MKRLILESKFTTHQKLHVLLCTGFPIVAIINLIYRVKPFFLKSLIVLFFIILLIAMICSIFLKKGIVKENNNLYQATFLFDKLLQKKKVDLNQKSKVSILKFKRSQKMAWFSVANPDASLTYLRSDVTLLNEKHTTKDVLVSLDDEEKANQVVAFLEEYFQFEYEIYSPDFS
ncbi:hypothetical protein [uncultured Tenacibaculum sp.]|uniref:hypothetical protein n=1 Tax=uncultured Tenacibaculum sp. TaxID=174713 RepID=UPI002612560B|nr:hypothetical protein [uncultured Tenacibaculum sp.]